MKTYKEWADKYDAEERSRIWARFDETFTIIADVRNIIEETKDAMSEVLQQENS